MRGPALLGVALGAAQPRPRPALGRPMWSSIQTEPLLFVNCERRPRRAAGVRAGLGATGGTGVPEVDPSTWSSPLTSEELRRSCRVPRGGVEH